MTRLPKVVWLTHRSDLIFHSFGIAWRVWAYMGIITWVCFTMEVTCCSLCTYEWNLG